VAIRRRNLGQVAAAITARRRHKAAVLQPQSGGNCGFRRRGRLSAAAQSDSAAASPRVACAAWAAADSFPPLLWRRAIGRHLCRPFAAATTRGLSHEWRKTPREFSAKYLIDPGGQLDTSRELVYPPLNCWWPRATQQFVVVDKLAGRPPLWGRRATRRIKDATNTTYLSRMAAPKVGGTAEQEPS